MKIDLQRAMEGGGRIRATVVLGPLDWEPGTALEAGPVAMRGVLSRLSRGYDFQGHLDGGLTLECVRCLEQFAFPLAFDFHLVFEAGDETPRGGEVQIQEGDCDVYLTTDGKVDLSAVAREQIYLQIPLKPVCNDRCRGLCMTCGESLDRGACRCGAQANVRVV